MQYTKQELSIYVEQSKNWHELFDLIGKNKTPGNYSYWKNKIISMNIDISHWNLPERYFHNGEYLVNNQKLKFRITGDVLKRHLIKTGREYKCEDCGLNKWKEKHISLHLDHINGDWKDNRPENLRFLCPNCHSQTESYCGKKNRVPPKLCDCGKTISNKSNNCVKCSARLRKPSEKIPPKEELESLVWTIPSIEIAKKYNVSDRSIGKWCKKYGISKPPRGYWTKFKK